MLKDIINVFFFVNKRNIAHCNEPLFAPCFLLPVMEQSGFSKGYIQTECMANINAVTW